MGNLKDKAKQKAHSLENKAHELKGEIKGRHKQKEAEGKHTYEQ